MNCQYCLWILSLWGENSKLQVCWFLLEILSNWQVIPSFWKVDILNVKCKIFTQQQRYASKLAYVLQLHYKYPNHSIIAHHRLYKAASLSPLQHINTSLFFPAGYVGMQLVPKTTRNPHQIGGVVLRLGAWSGAVWGWAAGEEGQTAGPVPVPLPGSLRRLDTSVGQKQTSRRTPAQTVVPWQRIGAEVRRTHRQVSSTTCSTWVVFIMV